MEELPSRAQRIGLIRNELNHIVDEWLHLHFRLATFLVSIAFLVEVCLAFFIANSVILSTTILRYIFKFIVVPSGLSLLCLISALFSIRSKRISQQMKIYTMSLLFVLICFVYYTAHSAFVAIYALYVFAIFLTTTYADYKLTTLTTLCSLASIIVSELFFYWDLDKVSVFEDAHRLFDFLIALSVIIGCDLLARVTIRYEQRKNEATLRREIERELLKESVLYDELTGAHNRKALHDELRRLELAAPTRPLVFCIADIDHFKSVNDLYGHHVGDLCLIEFAGILCEYFGESSVFRYGGDEFCLILKNTLLPEAEQLCERAQARLRRVEFEGMSDLRPTASFGLTEYCAQDGVSRLFNQADEALYEAKQTRNSIHIYRRTETPQGSFRVSAHEAVQP